jgi:hypothetical protein
VVAVRSTALEVVDADAKFSNPLTAELNSVSAFGA